MRDRESRRERRRRNVTINKILVPFVMMLFVLSLLLLMNLHSFAHIMNGKKYSTIRADVLEKTVDPFAMIVPMVDLSYKYNGTQYEQKKFFVLEPFFGLKAEKGSKLMIYVNNAAPNHFMIKKDFFYNWINWLLLLFEGVFVSLFVRRCRWAVLNRREKRKKNRNARAEQEKDERETDKEKRDGLPVREQTAEWRAAKELVTEQQKEDAWHIERREPNE